MSRIGSLFSGYGGLDQAVQQVLGGDVVWHCDPDPAATAVLDHHHPGVPNLGDITTTDWPSLATTAPIDILTGGFPCQDVSAAGRRAGLAPDTRSGLWTHMARAISVLNPSLVVIENVRGLLSARAHRDVEPGPDVLGDQHAQPVLRALGAVLGDLAELGFDARWHGLRAADVGAPHGRFRVFIVAWPVADTTGDRRHQGRSEPTRLLRGLDVALGGATPAAHSDRPRRQGAEPAPGPHLPARFPFADADGGRRGSVEPHDGWRETDIVWGDFKPAIRRWERTLGRSAPNPTEPGRNGLVLSPRFVEWLMGLDAGHVTAVPGLTRAAQLRLLGNGVVPHQAALAVRTLLDLDHPKEVPA